jgi:uncharacterized protein YaaN involved in tellurite resistance
MSKEPTSETKPTPTTTPEEGKVVEVTPTPAEGESAETTTALAVVPTAPPGIKDDELAALKEQANVLSAEVINESHTRTVLRKFDSLGRKEQDAVTAKMTLLETRVGTVLKDLDGDEQGVPKTLIELRLKLDDLNPAKTAKQRVFGLFPKKVRTALTEISVKYGTVKGEIDNTLNVLNAGREGLSEDNAELETLLMHVDNAQSEVHRKAYLGELIIQEVESRLANLPADANPANLKKLLHRTHMRVQDMRIMEQVNLQFDASITVTIDNNDSLIDTIDRVIAVARPLLAITLSLSVALQKQKDIAKATQAIQESMGDMLQANAANLRQQSADIGAMANNPVLGLSKVQAAYEDVMKAMDEAETNREKGIISARETIALVSVNNKALSDRTKAYRDNNPMPALEDSEEV